MNIGDVGMVLLVVPLIVAIWGVVGFGFYIAWKDVRTW